MRQAPNQCRQNLRACLPTEIDLLESACLVTSQFQVGLPSLRCAPLVWTTSCLFQEMLREAFGMYSRSKYIAGVFEKCKTKLQRIEIVINIAQNGANSNKFSGSLSVNEYYRTFSVRGDSNWLVSKRPWGQVCKQL